MAGMVVIEGGKDSSEAKEVVQSAGKPSSAQARYLTHGLDQPGGKLPLFDRDGQEIKVSTIRSCVEKGWAEPWFNNPLKPDWLVCRLTDTGRAALAKTEASSKAE